MVIVAMNTFLICIFEEFHTHLEDLTQTYYCKSVNYRQLYLTSRVGYFSVHWSLYAL